MDKEEIIRRLKKISKHAVHVTGEPLFIMSLDDGIALDEAVRLLKEQEPHVLTREEMKNMIGESVFVEEPPNNADPRCGWAEVTEGIEPPEEGFNFPGGVDFNAESGWDTYDGDLYGLDKGCGWRAWNRRPTPEQMKAVKWE